MKHKHGRSAFLSSTFVKLSMLWALMAGCGGSDNRQAAATGSQTDASLDGITGTSVPDAATSPTADAAALATLTEALLTLEISLQIAGSTEPFDPTLDAGASMPQDAGATADAGTPATLTIAAHDGATPVLTDLWLYTMDASGQLTPLTAFTSTASRKTPRLMLPSTIAGQPSGLSPADDGRTNGLMTGSTRGVRMQGQFVSTFTGRVTVSLAAVPTETLVVVAGIEDQRYAGAVAIAPDGTPTTPPANVGMPETHTRRSFQDDVAPILQAACIACHNPTGVDNAGFYLVTGSRDDLVNDNFAFAEQTLKCQMANPDGGAALSTCIANITQAQFLVEPGAPAISDLLQRARPDENAGTSAQGLLWYGSKGNRYNTTYGDRRMPSTTVSTDAADWTDQPAYFDRNPAAFQVIYDWVAQGALP
jgi:hypothetical protein